jgi:hypothetical protein
MAITTTGPDYPVALKPEDLARSTQEMGLFTVRPVTAVIFLEKGRKIP